MRNFLSLAIATCALLLTGCAGYHDTVEIASMPSGANVFINGELSGQTPMRVSLPQDATYAVRLEHEGYSPEVFNLNPVAVNHFIKFGPLVDTGFYKNLTPKDKQARMKPEFLTESLGLNPYEDFALNIVKVDALKKAGIISDEEHSYIMQIMVEHYAPKQECKKECEPKPECEAKAECEEKTEA